MKILLRRLDLGGILTISNSVLWVALLLIAQSRVVPESVVIGIAMVLSLPFALPFILPRGHHLPSDADVVAVLVVTGLNAFAWGYGLSWLWSHMFRRMTLRRLFAIVTAIAVVLGIAKWWIERLTVD
ncbi:MAG: hypothetical protein KDA55_22375 [Planctomycetales bacterium]|nr:hypothetical protein [Planctomycetales bacterium]